MKSHIMLTVPNRRWSSIGKSNHCMLPVTNVIPYSAEHVSTQDLPKHLNQVPYLRSAHLYSHPN
jgi:hypothetical protein